jgi:hypothetical protein
MSDGQQNHTETIIKADPVLVLPAPQPAASSTMHWIVCRFRPSESVANPPFPPADVGGSASLEHLIEWKNII